MVEAAFLKGKDIVSMTDFDRGQVDFILDRATEMMPVAEKGSEALKGKILATLFFEPSTRTRLSFARPKRMRKSRRTRKGNSGFAYAMLKSHGDQHQVTQ